MVPTTDNQLQLLFHTHDERWEGFLLLPERISQTITLEPIMNVLNDPRAFLPVRVEAPPFLWLVAKTAIRMLQWNFDNRDVMERHVPWDRRERVDCMIHPDIRLKGYLLMVSLQEGFARVQDYLNRPESFISIIDQVNPVIWLVNKRHLVRMGHVHD